MRLTVWVALVLFAGILLLELFSTADARGRWQVPDDPGTVVGSATSGKDAWGDAAGILRSSSVSEPQADGHRPVRDTVDG